MLETGPRRFPLVPLEAARVRARDHMEEFMDAREASMALDRAG